MDTILRYIEKYQYAIIATLLFHVAIFIGTNFSTVKSAIYIEHELEGDIPFDEIEMTPEMMELLEIMPKLTDAPPQDILNTGSDENDTREASSENFSTSKIDEDVLSEAKNLEKQYFEEWASTHKDDPSKLNTSIDDEREDKNRDKNNTPDHTITNKGPL